MDLLNGGMRQNGVYYLQIRGTTYWFLKVFCEQETAEGGWTVSFDIFPHPCESQLFQRIPLRKSRVLIMTDYDRRVALSSVTDELPLLDREK